MSVPDYRHVPKILFETELFNLHTHDGQHAFVDATVATLNGMDDKFRHLKKSASQTHIGRHGEDSALYLLPDNKAQAVDFIVGAGGTNPRPGWIPDPEPFYTHADAHDPDDHGIGDSTQPLPPPAPVQPYPSESPDGGWWGQVFDAQVAKRYAAKGRVYPDPNDPRSLRWCGRTAYDIRDGLTKESSLVKHLLELEQELGL